MARLAMKIKQGRIAAKLSEAHAKAKDRKEFRELAAKLPLKFHAVKSHNRCRRCGRSRAFIRRFGLCRLCFRDMALMGDIPGVVKASW